MNINICNKCGKPLRNEPSDLTLRDSTNTIAFHFCKECAEKFWYWLEDGDKENFNIKGWQA